MDGTNGRKHEGQCNRGPPGERRPGLTTPSACACPRSTTVAVGGNTLGLDQHPQRVLARRAGRLTARTDPEDRRQHVRLAQRGGKVQPRCGPRGPPGNTPGEKVESAVPPRQSTLTPLSLTSRVTTAAMRVVPLASFQTICPGTAMRRRSAARFSARDWPPWTRRSRCSICLDPPMLVGFVRVCIKSHARWEQRTRPKVKSAGTVS